MAKRFRPKSAVRKLKRKYVSGAAAKEEEIKEPLIPALPTGAPALPRRGEPIEVRVVGKPAVEIAEVAPGTEIRAEVEGAGAPGVTAAEEMRLEEEEEIQGISLEAVAPRRALAIPEERLEELRALRVSYPLTPARPKEGEPVYAWAEIFFDDKVGELVYHVREPALAKTDLRELNRIKSLIEEKIDVHFEALSEAQAIDYLKKQIDDIIKLFGMTITAEKRAAYEYYIFRDFIGLGKIQAVMNDGLIEDVSCDGVGIPLFVYHRDPKIGSVRSDVKFDNADELDSFIMKLAQRCKKSISVAEPLLQGALPDGSRVQATLGTDIARRGSNFTIRKFVTEPLTPVHMMNFGTLDAKMLAYLWFAIEHNSSILVAGPTASGKTSLLNALALFIKPSLKVVSIEDTAELRLPLPNWVPHVARAGFGTTSTGLKIGEISMFDLLKASLRQRPDYIIVGEVRGEEAYVLFQEMASIPGNERVLVANDHNLKRMPIDELEVREGFLVPAVNPKTQRVGLLPVKAKVTHPSTNEFYNIRTKSGRELTTTRDHSVFTYEDELKPVVVGNLRPGAKIAIPARLPCGFNDIDYLNLLELFPDIRVYAPTLIKKASRLLGFKKASKVAGVASISDYYGVKDCALRSDKFVRLMREAGIKYDVQKLKTRFRGGKTGSATIAISDEFLRLLGYYISEGSLNKAKKNNRISLYNKNREILADMYRCIKTVTGTKVKSSMTFGFGTPTKLSFNHKTFFELLKRLCGTRSFTKRVPDFVFGLSKERIGQFLSALYSGDGQIRQKGFVYSTTSKDLANDVSLLLLVFGIVGRIRTRLATKRDVYDVVLYRKEDYKKFLSYVHRGGEDSRIDYIPQKENDKKDRFGDIFLDEVVEIKKVILKNPIPVYDLHVPSAQNFVGGFGGILLHNTGHAGMSTLHADSLDKIIDRLTTPPIELPASLLETLDLVVFIKFLRYRERYVRRVSEIVEVLRYDLKEKTLKTVKTFNWDPSTDKFSIDKDSVLLAKIAQQYGMKEERVKAELANRIKILEWMRERGISYYRDVGRIFSLYYSNPSRLMTMVET